MQRAGRDFKWRKSPRWLGHRSRRAATFAGAIPCLALGTALWTVQMAAAQPPDCRELGDQRAGLIQQKIDQIHYLDSVRSELAAHRRYVIGLNAELDAVYRRHDARMTEVASRMAELEGNQFEKFLPATAIRRDRDRYAAETRSDLAKARREWRSQLFSDRSDIDGDIRGRKKLIARQYDAAIAKLPRTNCTTYGSIGIRG